MQVLKEGHKRHSADESGAAPGAYKRLGFDSGARHRYETSTKRPQTNHEDEDPIGRIRVADFWCGRIRHLFTKINVRAAKVPRWHSCLGLRSRPLSLPAARLFVRLQKANATLVVEFGPEFRSMPIRHSRGGERGVLPSNSRNKLLGNFPKKAWAPNLGIGTLESPSHLLRAPTTQVREAMQSRRTSDRHFM
jgi:hypothetical protein